MVSLCSSIGELSTAQCLLSEGHGGTTMTRLGLLVTCCVTF
jgi:hypothetical protein